MRIYPTARLAALAVVVCACLDPLLNAQFEFRGSAPISVEPYTVAFGDFNGDGKTDAAVADYGGASVAILIGNGDGTFKPATYYPVETGPEFIYTPDLKQDGTLDIVVSNLTSQSISVLLGRGDGTFDMSFPLPLIGQPNFAGVGDFNNDGYPDIYAAVGDSVSCGCIAVLLGNGDGTFRDPILTHLAASVFAAGAGHFTNSGNLDVVAGESFGSSQIEVLLGNGDGTFRHGTVYATSALAESFAVADFNGDKKEDLAIDTPLSGSVTIFLGNGDGTFQQSSTIPALFPAAIQSADFNDDGIADFVVTTGLYSQTVSVYLGNGNGTFRSFMNFSAGNGAAPFVADVNGDNQTDIVIANDLGNAVVTHLNTGVVTFSPSSPLNFKTQKVGTTSAPKVITLKNTGKTTLKIASMKTTGQFGMTSSCQSKVAAGASCKISVTFSPKSQGAKSGTVTIEDGASVKPQIIALSGVGD
jgi:hypothetical protein